MNETNQAPEVSSAETPEVIFAEKRQVFFGIKRGAWGWDISKDLPDKTQVIVLLQAGLDSFKTREANAVSAYSEPEDFIWKQKYEWALAYAKGKSKNDTSFLKVLSQWKKDEREDTARQIKKKPGILESEHERESFNMAKNNYSLAQQRINQVSEHAQDLFRPTK